MVNAMKRLIFPLVLVSCGIALRAQQPGDDPADAAQHGVARVSLATGSVNILRGDSGEPGGSAMNAPLVTGDRISTGEGSRAEVQFDANNLVRLAPATDVRMGDL